MHFLNPKHVYHPLVHATTGEVNLDFDFPEWQPGKHWAIQILMSIKKMLHLEPYFKLGPAQEGGEDRENLAWNREALRDFKEKFEKVFVENCKECVQLSNEDRFKELPDKSV